MLVAFSCRGRSLCPSCEKKRQLLWAEWLCEEVLGKVAHRHFVLTIPRLLRPLFRRRCELLTEPGRSAAEAVTELVRRGLGDEVCPGIVVSIATAGDLVQWHPHLHLLTTDGGKTADGSWQPLPQWDGLLMMRLFRERLLARLVEAHGISPELVKKLLAWKHPGFSAHVGEPIAPTDKLRLEDTAAYLVRNPLSLRKLVYLDSRQHAALRAERGRAALPDQAPGRAGPQDAAPRRDELDVARRAAGPLNGLEPSASGAPSRLGHDRVVVRD